VAAIKMAMRPARAANLLGLPSACVPADRDAETGLPIGVILTGRRLRADSVPGCGRGHADRSGALTGAIECTLRASDRGAPIDGIAAE